MLQYCRLIVIAFLGLCGCSGTSGGDIAEVQSGDAICVFHCGSHLRVKSDLWPLFDSFPIEGVSSNGLRFSKDCTFPLPMFYVNGERKKFLVYLLIIKRGLEMMAENQQLTLFNVYSEAFYEMLKRVQNSKIDFDHLLRDRSITGTDEEFIRYGGFLRHTYFHTAYSMVLEEDLKAHGWVGDGTYSECWKCKFKIPPINIATRETDAEIKEFYVYKKLKIHPELQITPTNEEMTEGSTAISLQGIEGLSKAVALVIRRPKAQSREPNPNPKPRTITVRGYLFDWAEYGDLTRFLRKNTIPLDRNFILNLQKVALSMHQIHLRGFIHRDLRTANIFVAKGSGQDCAYEFLVGDFGLSCRLGKGGTCEALHPFAGWERAQTYPIEIFDKKLQDKLLPSTDWFEFGTLLRDIGSHWKEHQSEWIALIYPLVLALTRRNMSSGDRWGWLQVNEYFEMILAEREIPSFTFTFGFVVGALEKERETIRVQVTSSHTEQPNYITKAIAFHMLYESAFAFKGGFLPMHFGRTHKFATVEWSREHEIAPSCFTMGMPLIVRFIQSFPFHVTSDVTHMERRLFSEGDYLVLQSNLHFVCFCEEFCLLHSFLKCECCLEMVSSEVVVEKINGMENGPYLVLV